jgi:hypothetical protein
MPQTTDQPTIAPCPFCGGAAYRQEVIEHYPASADGPAGSYSAWFHIGCNVCGIEVGGEYEYEAEAAWNRRAVPLVAEAPREPVAWRDCWGDPHRTRQAAINSDDSEEPAPLYAALPTSLAPMPEECSVSQWSSRCCERGTKGCTVSHLRTAPRPTLSDEQIAQIADAAGICCLPSPVTWTALKKFARLVSVAPQPEQPKPDAHLAANRESAVQGLDAAAGVKGPDHG